MISLHTFCIDLKKKSHHIIRNVLWIWFCSVFLFIIILVVVYLLAAILQPQNCPTRLSNRRRLFICILARIQWNTWSKTGVRHACVTLSQGVIGVHKPSRASKSFEPGHFFVHTCWLSSQLPTDGKMKLSLIVTGNVMQIVLVKYLLPNKHDWACLIHSLLLIPFKVWCLCDVSYEIICRQTKCCRGERCRLWLQGLALQGLICLNF